MSRISNTRAHKAQRLARQKGANHMTTTYTPAARSAGAAEVQDAINFEAAVQREQVALGNENDHGIGNAIGAIRHRCLKAGYPVFFCPDCGAEAMEVSMNMGRDQVRACGPCGKFF